MLSCRPFTLSSPASIVNSDGTKFPSPAFPSQPRLRRSSLPAPALPRRLFLTSASAIWDAITGAGGGAAAAVRRGMQLFRQGDVSGSVAEFDRAIELDPRQKICGRGGCRCTTWTGLVSFYVYCVTVSVVLDGLCCCRFEEGAEQFRLDVAMNPNDTEESIWCFLCEVQLYGVDEARGRFLEVGQDTRPVMRDAYNMFKYGGDPEKLVSTFMHGRENEYFYASLYAGLYHESQKNMEASKLHILEACQSPYGSRLEDYMASLAKVHCLCRNWNIS